MNSEMRQLGRKHKYLFATCPLGYTGGLMRLIDGL